MDHQGTCTPLYTNHHLSLCWKAYLKTSTPHHQHWADSIQVIKQPLVSDWSATPELLCLLSLKVQSKVARAGVKNAWPKCFNCHWIDHVIN